MDAKKEVIAEILNDQNTSDSSQLAALLGQIVMPIASFTSDGAYDSDETYEAVRRHSRSVSIIVLSRLRKSQGTHHDPPDQ
ncbi:hypothetical protein [Ochrobactrum sp. AN78]|uniref:hypothetical protein n=1 Tax=Ochrobactrum sp. AN78 TaxID=3039853 RepID=UPI002989D528|nr:hypothetical protein [Ochrobactrum sp. AN78]MDH7791622.1 hypothetical protein [Ochrobactrum sp. AN78]